MNRFLDEYDVSGMGLNPWAIDRGPLAHPRSDSRHTIELTQIPFPRYMDYSCVEGDPVNIPTLGFRPGTIDFIITTPHSVFGGDDLWKDGLRDYLLKAWRRVLWTLRYDGMVFVDVVDQLEDGKRVPLTAWHKGTLGAMGVEWVDEIMLGSRRNRRGETEDDKVLFHTMLIGRKV